MLLMLCVNDHRNGVFTGRCRSISLADPDHLTIESPWLDSALKCRLDYGVFGLGKSALWPHDGLQEWVGNWCWNAVVVEPETAAHVINFAVRRGYRPTVGAGHLWKLIEARKPVTAADLVAG